MEILSYMMEEILDPTNIIEGERYEFTLELNIEEDDELYQEGGVDLRAIIAKKDNEISMVNYFLIAKSDQSHLEFGLDEDEEAEIVEFCKTYLIEVE